MRCSVNGPIPSDNPRRISRLYIHPPRSPSASTRCYHRFSHAKKSFAQVPDTEFSQLQGPGERCDTSCHFCCTKTFDGNIA